MDNELNIIFYILIILVKYLLFIIIFPFNFIFYQFCEIFSIYQYFYNYNTNLKYWISWTLFGNLPDNKTNYLPLFNKNYYLSNILLLNFYGNITALILIPLLIYLIKKITKYNNFNIYEIITQLIFVSFLPITTLSISLIKNIEYTSILNCIISIILFSIVSIGFPAVIFNFIYGNEKKIWRRRLYYILSPYKIQFKILSNIILLKKLMIAISINLFSINSGIANSLIMLIITLYLIYVIIKNPFEIYFSYYQEILNSLCLLIIGVFNLLINVYKLNELIICCFILFFISFLSNIYFIYKIRYFKIKKEPEEIELKEIKSINKISISMWDLEEDTQVRKLENGITDIII